MLPKFWNDGVRRYRNKSSWLLQKQIEFEYGGESNLSFLGVLGLQDSHARKKHGNFFRRKFHVERKVSSNKLMEGIKNLAPEKEVRE